MKKLLLLILSAIFFQIAFSQTYTFTGNGYWAVASNWSNNATPPAVLPAGDTVIISPAAGDSCVLDVAQRISQGAIFIVSPGASFIIHSTLNISDGKPLVITTPAAWASGCQAQLGGNVIDSGSAPVTSRGVMWSTTPDSVTIDQLITNGTGIGAFSSTLVNLFSSTTYYARAFATNALGTTYGNEISFTTSQPYYIVNTYPPSSITTNSAWSGAVIDNTGQVCPNNILAEGVVWDTVPTPTIDLPTKTNDGSGRISYNSILSNLQPGTTYYVRAYAIINGIGPVYGYEATFTTLGAPIVTTDTISNITLTSATSGGSIISSGNSSVIATGLVWDTLPNPRIALSTKTVNGVITTTFINDISNLQPARRYYVRAYATNNTGTGYGNERSFTTLSFSPPIVLTNPVTDITDTYAISGGIITSNGGSTVTASGLVWDTLPSPAVTLSTKTVNEILTDTFHNTITGLQPNKTYYIRAYGTNSMGTGYGNERSFITPIADSTFTDPRDGQIYTFKHIGTQVWMTQNLNYVTASGSWCYGNNTSNCGTYGRMYNWNTALAVAPPGWHLPSDAEWQTLINYLGGDAVAGGVMKSTSSLWQSPNTGATNSSGFAGLPGGSRYINGAFMGDIGAAGYWWSSTAANSEDSWPCSLYYSDTAVHRPPFEKTMGFSVRCIRD